MATDTSSGLQDFNDDHRVVIANLAHRMRSISSSSGNASPPVNYPQTRRDARQAALVLDAVARSMPHYPLDNEFAATLPDELATLFAAWRDERDAQLNTTPKAPATRW